jgi:hypothetical protein
MCQRRPCWPTPEDAQRLIAANLGGRLMRDWWFDHAQDKTILILTPALQGREASEAPAYPKGPCTFVDAEGLCQLHSLGLKPTEGRLALCHNRTPENLHADTGRTWDSEAGRAVIQHWGTHHQRPIPPTLRRKATGRLRFRSPR